MIHAVVFPSSTVFSVKGEEEEPFLSYSHSAQCRLKCEMELCVLRMSPLAAAVMMVLAAAPYASADDVTLV